MKNPIVSLLLFLLLGATVPLHASPAPPNRSMAQVGGVTLELWCVAKNNADDGALQGALDWACGPGATDCRPIQPGGPCYDSTDLQQRASYAFNDYYIKHGSSDDSCDFGSTAALTSLDPSFSNCKFPSSTTANNGSITIQGMAPGIADMSGCSKMTGRRWGWAIIIIHLVFTIIHGL
ncbi:PLASMODESMATA CALLOSE-BINDING PROTEIN 5-like [Malania oleifera]|uniref:PLASMODESMATA CALLOSE-BINDING PROTEIN 5-like n=1 Tax=Malania oleifera TaxID=397392 RepID=UPI0025ADC6D9|nr:PLASMODESMATA CALLOSE-BINDING PROTEIN 5-like [Malania oleifera]